MKYSRQAKQLVLGAGLGLLLGTAMAQTGKVDLGKQEYESNCAVCHGNAGKGNGPYAPMLQRKPPDMTQLSKQNGGVFPINRMYEMIDGADVPSHGSRDMPIWGRAYRIQAGEYYVDTPYNSEAFVRARILALVEYINRLQVK
jgi:mono/diheme cytochrome c family protein